MASATSELDEDRLEHMIIWLDIHIGQPEHYQRLKAAFASTIDPKNENPVNLIDRDSDEFLRDTDLKRVNFEGVWFLLAAFTDIDQCIQCFEQNQDKRIFFITSGSLGRDVVPRIMERFERVFIDPVTDESYDSIYIFCHHIEYHVNWALPYRRYIQIFNFDADLLVRIVRDIADYYVTRSKRLLREDPPNNKAAYHRLSWADELYQRYRKLQNDPLRTEFAELNQLLDQAAEEMQESTDEDEFNSTSEI